MRPLLNKEMNSREFLQYYWLKEELIDFCRSHGIPGGGSKAEVSQRIANFLQTGQVPKGRKKGRASSYKAEPLHLDARIPEGYRNDQRHRSFFLEVIGPRFKFNGPFMQWMKENPGKTYREAVAQWRSIQLQMKRGDKRDILPQFEYNQYTRDFFKENPRRSRQEAIQCWKYKKSLPGHNRYETGDLEVLPCV